MNLYQCSHVVIYTLLNFLVLQLFKFITFIKNQAQIIAINKIIKIEINKFTTCWPPISFSYLKTNLTYYIVQGVSIVPHGFCFPFSQQGLKVLILCCYLPQSLGFFLSTNQQHYASFLNYRAYFKPRLRRVIKEIKQPGK